MKLLTLNNHKIEKTNKLKHKYLTAILHLAPHKTSGYNVCPKASKSCSATCLFYSGFGRYKYIQEARIRKTKLLMENRDLFKEYLFKDIESLIRKCKIDKKKPCVRLNGTSDLAWEKIFPDIFTSFPAVQFYDYTKIITKYKRFLNNQLPNNYFLIFSRSETNEEECLDILESGGSVAIVFDQLPKIWNGYRVVNGDSHDLRFLDSKPKTICGLLAKGRAKHEKNNFVVRNL